MKDKRTELELSSYARENVCYSNLVVISHSPDEFVLDFAQCLPALDKPYITDRIVMTPYHVSRFLGALIENVQKYEKTFGVIDKEKNNDIWKGGENYD